MKKYIIDRFEGKYAVLEDEAGKMHNVPKEKLPEGARRGDCLRLIGKAFEPDPERTAARAEKIAQLQKKLFE